ncbi:MAG: glycosyltransferase family 2 protein [Nitrospirae bacterium]|nr:glycosyltransferase family 2 protein [Nitrospirota bacterium]
MNDDKSGLNNDPRKTIIVMPAFNEEESIRHTLDNIISQNLGFDIVVVNDGSRDNTASEVLKSGIDILNLPCNLGYGAAVETGFRYAIKNGYSRVVLMDADGQHDPKYIRSMADAMDSDKFDVIIGSRFRGDVNYTIPKIRKLGMVFFRNIVKIMTKQDIQDVTSGFQLLNRKAVMFLLNENYPSDYPDSDVIAKLLLVGFRVSEVPVTIHAREKGLSMHSSKLKITYYIYKMVLSLLLVALTYRMNKRLQKEVEY